MILSDIRAELGPYKTLDLEKVVRQERVESSINLRQALDLGTLCLVKHSVVHGPRRHTEVLPNAMSKAEMELIMRKIMAEYQTPPAEPQPIPEAKDNTEEVGKIFENKMDKLMDSIRQEINSISIADGDGNKRGGGVPMPAIDQAKLAEIQQKAVAKLGDEVSASVKKGRKITIKNRKMDDIASELGE